MKKLLRRPAVQKCEHGDTITTTSSGIQRIVCQTCSHVSMSALDDVVTSASRQLESEEAVA